MSCKVCEGNRRRMSDYEVVKATARKAMRLDGGDDAWVIYSDGGVFRFCKEAEYKGEENNIEEYIYND